MAVKKNSGQGSRGLSPQQKEFCRAYAESGNAVEACRAAGYSESTALHKSSSMVKRAVIVAEVSRLRKVVNMEADKSSVDVINAYSVVAFSDHVDFLKPDPDYEGAWIYKSPDELTKEQRQVVEKVELKDVFAENAEGEAFMVRQEYNYIFSNKMDALNQMGRHFGIFDDKLRLSGPGTNPFKNASSDALVQIKQAITGIMGTETIDGEYSEQALPDAK